MAGKEGSPVTRFEIIEARTHHCGQIIRRLRDEHQAAIRGLGISSHHAIRSHFDGSTFRKAWLINGRLAGLGGVTGPALSDTGFIWLALTNEAASHPYAVAREAMRQISEIMILKRTLYTNLIPEDKAALRFAFRIGFEVINSTPIPLGRGRVISVRYSRKSAEKAA